MLYITGRGAFMHFCVQNNVKSILIWLILMMVVAVPLYAAATSPLLAWRDPVYIAAGFAGVFAMPLLLFQPLLAVGLIPGIGLLQGRRVHCWSGVLLVATVILHVVGLWITSPPDVIDAFLFVSATPFSIWGVLAMWCLFAVATLVVFRQKLSLRPWVWILTHKMLAAAIVVGSVVHALLIDGTMQFVSKLALCILVSVATGIALFNVKWRW